MTNISVGFDLDGVGEDFFEVVKPLALDRGIDPERLVPPTHWDFYQDWPMTDEDFVDMCHEAADRYELFGTTPPLPGFAESVRRVKRTGFEVVIITDRNFGTKGFNSPSRAATYSWLKQYDIPYDRVVFTADKGSVDVDFMIDDKIQNYDEMTAAGVCVALLERPWNWVRGGDERLRVSSVESYVQAVFLASIMELGV